MWTVTILFPLRFEVLPLVLGFFIYLTLAPIAEASEQTIVQKVVPFEEQGRVFGFAQTVETAAAPVQPGGDTEAPSRARSAAS